MAQPDVYKLLSSEQQHFAEVATAAISERFAVEPSELRIVVEESPDMPDSRAILLDASPNGQFVGLYRDILAEREADPSWNFIEVMGRSIDPLQACTKAAYRAMIADARARGIQYLPDSLALNQYNGHVWTATMLTGDPLPSPDKIWIASSSGGKKVNIVDHPTNRGGRSFRVRPGVIIGRVLSHDPS